MKESEISEPSRVEPRSPQGVHYRYFSSPPSRVSLRLGDIASQIPENVRLPTFDPERSIDLPCEEVFSGPSPKLLMSRLAEIAKDHLRLDGGFDLLLSLPVAPLALAYRLIQRSEILEKAPSKAESQDGQALDFAPAKEEPGGTSAQRKAEVAPEDLRSSPGKTSGRRPLSTRLSFSLRLCPQTPAIQRPRRSPSMGAPLPAPRAPELCRRRMCDRKILTILEARWRMERCWKSPLLLRFLRTANFLERKNVVGHPI